MKSTGSGLGVATEEALSASSIRRLKFSPQRNVAYSKNELIGLNAELQGKIDRLRAVNWELQSENAELHALNAALSAASVEHESNICQWARLSHERDALEAELTRAIEQRDQFLATLSHELRNPMAAIRNSLAVLRHPRAADEERRSALCTLERQANQMAYLLDDLLDVCRLTHGKIRYQMRRLDLRCVIHDAVASLRPAIDQNQHTLQLGIGELPVFVKADEARLLQVVENLLANACKYTPAGGVIRIELTQVDQHCHLTVTDNGQGISRDMLAKVFDLFTQSENNLDRGDPGMGLGLTVVKALVEDHAGTIQAFSEGTGKGATFAVELPLQSPSDPVDALPQGATNALSTNNLLRVLVVEDNLDARHMLLALLELEGFAVTGCGDGETALQMMRVGIPDVALIDIGLPRIDGYAVARRFRAQCPNASVRLIALTGYGHSVDVVRATQAGFDAHLTKPIDPNRLIDILRRNPC